MQFLLPKIKLIAHCYLRDEHIEILSIGLKVNTKIKTLILCIFNTFI